MTYFVLLGKNDPYGDQAVPTSQTPHIYRGFRFRDPTCIDTGRTQNYAIVPLFTEDIYTQVLSTISEACYKDYNGFFWKEHDGTRPDDTQFTRHPHGYNIDSRSDRWSFGVQCVPKQNPQVSKNEGYILSSTWKAYKDRRDL